MRVVTNNAATNTVATSRVAVALVAAFASTACLGGDTNVAVPVVVVLDSTTCDQLDPEEIELGCANHVRVSLLQEEITVDSVCSPISGNTLADISSVLADVAFDGLKEGQSYSLLIEIFDADSCDSPDSELLFVGVSPPTVFSGDEPTLVIDFTCLPREPSCEPPPSNDRQVDAFIESIPFGEPVLNPNVGVEFGEIVGNEFISLTVLISNGGPYTGIYDGPSVFDCPATAVFDNNAIGSIISCENDFAPAEEPLTTTGFAFDEQFGQTLAGALEQAQMNADGLVLGRVETLNDDGSGFVVTPDTQGEIRYLDEADRFVEQGPTGPSGVFAIVNAPPGCCVSASATNGEAEAFALASAPSVPGFIGFFRLLSD